MILTISGEMAAGAGFVSFIAQADISHRGQDRFNSARNADSA
jgi:hypothetical protein